MFCYEESFWNEFVSASFKLFLESYFDIVICTFLNLKAFIQKNDMNDFKEFFATNDDIMCSTITIFYTCLVVYFPVYAYFKIKFHQDNFDDPDPFLETLLEGVNPHNYHASMYTVYFLIRRFLTGFGLVVFVANPFFQCASLMVFTTVNLIYLINIQPLEDSK